MVSRASYSDSMRISGPLFKENMRRFWPIPLIGTLIYLLSSALPILMAYDRINTQAHFINSMLKCQHVVFFPGLFALPVVTAIVVFGYLQYTSSTTMMHSLPFTRRELYVTNWISGFVMSYIPVLITGIVLLAIAKPTFYPYYFDMNGALLPDYTPDVLENVFSRGAVLNWMWESLLVMLVIYSIAVFSGVVTGTRPMHLLASIGFNFIVPVMVFIVSLYCQQYLYGFCVSDSFESMLMSLAPMVKILASGGVFSARVCAAYIIVAAAVTLLSGWLYTRRRLEKATDSVAFGFMLPMVTFIISFLGMTLMGAYFAMQFDSERYLYAGYVVGAVIAFFAARMILLKTPKVFNRKSFLNLGIFVIIAVVFLAFFQLDLTGFEKRTPAASSVKSVDVSMPATGWNGEDRLLARLYNQDEEYVTSNGFIFRDPENIQAVINIHKDIIAMAAEKNRGGGVLFSSPETTEAQVYDPVYTMNIDYDNSGVFDMSRIYTVPYSYLASSADYRQLFESEEYKSFFSLKNLRCEHVNSITLSAPINSEYYNVTISDSGELEELIGCIDSDFADRTLDEQLDGGGQYANLALKYATGAFNRDGSPEVQTIQWKILKSDTATIAWLRKNGYDETIRITADAINCVRVTHTYLHDDEYGNHDISFTDGKIGFIYDKAQIAELLDSYDTRMFGAPNYYELTFVIDENYLTDSRREALAAWKEAEASGNYFEYYDESTGKYYNSYEQIFNDGFAMITEEKAPAYLKALF